MVSITPQQVLSLYEQIQFGKTRQIKNDANLQILAFLESVQAWAVAFQLLTGTEAQQDQFIGAQIIFKKIETHFDQIEAKDAQILEVRNTLFHILPQTYSKKLVMDRLCMSISLLALRTSNTCWSTSIADFIKMGSESAEKCFVCLALLKHVTAMFDSQCHERRQKQIAEAYIRENLPIVLAYLSQVLEQQGLPRECYFEALSAAKAWCQFSTTTFVANVQFVQTLFKVMQTELFSKSVKIVKKLLTVSKYAKSLQHAARDDAINMVGMTQDDKQFLQQVILLLQANLARFQQHRSVQQFQEDEDETDHFPRKFVNLVTCLCSNYEFLMVTPDLAPGLFAILKQCARAGNLRLAISSLDFWTDFKETIYTCKLTNHESLLNEFKEVSQIMLNQSALLQSIPYHQLTAEEVEELEIQEKGVPLTRFRECTSELLLITYLLLQREYGAKGEIVVYQMLQTLGNPEVCYFGARQIYDGIDENEWNQPTLQFLQECFMGVSTSSQDFCLIRSQLQFIAETSQALVECKQLQSHIVRFCIQQVYNERLRSLALSALNSVCEYCKTQLGPEEITQIFEFMQTAYQHLSAEHAAKLVKSASLIASILDEAHLYKAIDQICQIPVKDLQEQSNDRLRAIKALSSLKGLIVSINDLPSLTLRISLTALFTQTWPQCEQLFQTKAGDAELIECLCDFLVEVVACMAQEMGAVFLQIQDVLLRCFIQSPVANSRCLKAYTSICGTIAKKNDQVKSTVLQTVAQVLQTILPIMIKPAQQQQDFVQKVDPEVVAQFAGYLTKILELSGDIIVLNPMFEQIIQFLAQSIVYVLQPDLTNMVVSFFLKLIEQGNHKLSPESKQHLVAQYVNMIPALMSVVPIDQTNTILINRVSQSFVHILNQCQGLDLHSALVNAFETTAQLRSVPPKIRTVVADFILVFGQQLMKVRLCLQTVCWFVHGQTGEDGFLGLELQVQQRAKQSSQQNQNQQIVEL